MTIALRLLILLLFVCSSTSGNAQKAVNGHSSIPTASNTQPDPAHPNKAVGHKASPGLLTHTDEMAEEMGLTAIEYGPYEKDEDDRFLTNLRNAYDVKILAPNATHLTEIFKNELTQFLQKPSSSMEVILATADSDFYREETDMTLGFKPGEDRYENNRRLVDLSRQRLELYAGNAKDHLHIRYFDTQYRLPIIIIDNKYCYLTIRLSPNEPAQSLRMEFSQGADPNKGYYNACRLHFDKLWNLSRDTPESSHWLAALGLSEWSRTELIAFVACLGTFLGGLGGLLGVPAVQRLLRLERELAQTGPAIGRDDAETRGAKREVGRAQENLTVLPAIEADADPVVSVSPSNHALPPTTTPTEPRNP